MKVNNANCLSSVMYSESAVPGTPSVARLLRRLWNQLRFSLCALEFLLARHHRMGWHAQLDEDALECRVKRLAACQRNLQLTDIQAPNLVAPGLSPTHAYPLLPR